MDKILNFVLKAAAIAAVVVVLFAGGIFLYRQWTDPPIPSGFSRERHSGRCQSVCEGQAFGTKVPMQCPGDPDGTTRCACVCR